MTKADLMYDSPELLSYYKTEWGKPEHDDQRLFELLCMELYQAGLSWRTVLNKRAAFRTAFKDYEIKDVNTVAKMYTDTFLHMDMDKKIILPMIKEGYISSWAQYTIQLPNDVERSLVQKKLKEQGIPTMVYYMKPMHQQGAFEETDSSIAECPVTEEICNRVLSIPIHPYMTEEQVKTVVNALKMTLEQV